MTRSNLFEFDKKNIINGSFLIGTDEAGRGPGAGPVVAAAVCFNNYDKKLRSLLLDVNDSKKLSEKKREELYNLIAENAIYDVAFGSVEDIEKNNILKTSLFCMKKACLSVIEQLKSNNVLILVDGNKLVPEFDYSQKYIIKGDGKSAAIAAASIVAKVTRDRYMNTLAKDFPEYKWDKNKGYLTKEHINAVDKFGLTVHHRKKFFEKHFAAQLSLF